MAAKPIVWGIAIILMLAIVVVTVDYVVLLSMKFEFNADCRAALLKMEDQGGLSNDERNNLQERLADKGFSNISITAPLTAAKGQEVVLKVEADYDYNKLLSIFSDRINSRQKMIYSKVSMSRRVVN